MERGTHKKTVLALDPSLTAFGWAVLQGATVLDAGCVKTETSGKKSRIRKTDDRMRRVSEINAVLCEKIRMYDVAYIVSELPHGSQSAVAAIAIGLVAGQVQGIADALEIGIEWFSEGDSKNHLLGKRSASKGETIAAVDKVYGVPWAKANYINEAIADSISIYHVARHMSPTIKFLTTC